MTSFALPVTCNSYVQLIVVSIYVYRSEEGSSQVFLPFVCVSNITILKYLSFKIPNLILST